MQPGETIQPGAEPPKDKPKETKAAPKATTPPKAEETQAQPTADVPWDYDPNADTSLVDGQTNMPLPPSVPPVTWTASEYVSHHKGSAWFLFLALGTAVVAGLAYLLTKELISPAVIGIVGLVFGVFAVRKPQVLEYTVDSTGVQIGPKVYSYHMFRSFSVLEEDAIHSILLMPMQRFGLPITIYYDPDDESHIVSVLGTYLPHEQREVAPIDRLMSKIHF